MTELTQEAVTQIRLLREQVELMASRVEEAEEKASHLQTVTVSKEELRARRLQTFIVSFAVAAVLLLIVLPMALNRYEDNYSAMVTKCFIVSQQSLADKDRCDERFPGYKDLKVQADQRLIVFNELAKTIPENRGRIIELEKQVAQLQGAKQ